jgi:hypothetical protein
MSLQRSRVDFYAAAAAPFQLHQKNTSPALRLHAKAMFVFFSNKLGCLGSIAVSVVLTLLLLLLFRLI